jgi:hypothetical protein
MGTERAEQHGEQTEMLDHHHLTELIADEVGGDDRSPRKTAGRLPSDLLVQYVASTFILVLNWWLESRSSLAPKEVNDLFRSLIRPAFCRMTDEPARGAESLVRTSWVHLESTRI